MEGCPLYQIFGPEGSKIIGGLKFYDTGTGILYFDLCSTGDSMRSSV